jgi:ADP-ribosylglycohydrolase/alpha/beta superfamily hydrolase
LGVKLSMQSQLKALLLGSLIGDALSMGSLWIYNPKMIERKFGRVSDYNLPEPNKYHPTKKSGDFTHYGDQTLVLLESVAEQRAFDLSDFSTRWRQLFSNYEGYVDGATTDTLGHYSSGLSSEKAGSSSNDLAGASRIAPILIAYAQKDFNEVQAAVEAQTAMTHNDPQVIETATFFARVVFRIIEGIGIEEAIEYAALFDYNHLPAEEWLELAINHLELDSVSALQKLGQDCHIDHAFPATLYLLLKYGDSFETANIENIMAGGDSAARGLIIGMVLGCKYGLESIPDKWITDLNAFETIDNYFKMLFPENEGIQTDLKGGKVSFLNSEGHKLDARLEQPPEQPKAIALFAHCFTCSKEIAVATRISRALAGKGIAVLRFDFTGLGNSDGDFANTNFSSNIQDLVSAADFLRENIAAPTVLIGHSLGGTAVIAAGLQIPEVKGIVTIGAPSDPSHVSHLFKSKLDKIEAEGEATVLLAGREFRVKKQFIDDLNNQSVLKSLIDSRVNLLVMHAPGDETVNIDHARLIYDAARHPKSFISLDDADHLLTRKKDSTFVAEMIAAWSTRFI